MVATAGRASAASTCSASPAPSRSAAASWPCSSRSTTASRSASRATSTSRLAAAHFFYYAGWADKLELRRLRPDAAAARRGRADHPVELPAADGGVEDRARAGRGNTVVLKPAETTPLTALVLAEIIAEADLPPGVVNILAGGPAIGAGASSSTPASTRSRSPARPRSARSSSARVAGTGKRLTLELGGKAANIVFDDAPLDQAVEGIVNGIFFNQGQVCCAGSRLLVQESIADELVDRAAGGGWRTLRVGDPLDKNTDIGAINSAAQLARIRELADAGEAEGATRWSPPCELPDARLLVRARRCSPASRRPPHRPRGDLRPGAVGADVPHPGRGDREGQQHALRPVGRRLDREGLAHPVDGRAGCGPAWCGPTRSTASTRPRRSAATRSPASAARAAGTAWRPTSMSDTA